MDNNIFRNIMVATDGSQLARKAIDSAILIAKQNEAKLYVVYVIDLQAYYSSIPFSIDAEWMEVMEDHLRTQGKEATTYVENAGRTANILVESVILEGNPADEIANFADKHDIDVIVMGSLGKTGIQRFLLGSVTENVIRHSKKPVLIMR
jgi:nucleotide-binding universal stress UspA family protein